MSSSETTATSRAARVVYESAPLMTDDIASAKRARSETFARDTTDVGICVADGLGLRLAVDRGALIVEDGIGEHRRSRRFDKATHGLRRLVVLGTTGSCSLEALDWCRRLGIGVLVLAPDGTSVMAPTPRVTDDARLRRAQARCMDEPVGLDLARWVMVNKVNGQALVLRQRLGDSDGASTLWGLAEAVMLAKTADEIRQLEASAAAIYFAAWVGRPETAPRFIAKDAHRIPPHWTRFEGRRSVLTSSNSNKKAERPTNAILNYVYALVE